MSENGVNPEILTQTILLMATFAMAKVYSKETVCELFELHQKNLVEQYGFNHEDVMAITSNILQSLQGIIELGKEDDARS